MNDKLRKNEQDLNDVAVVIERLPSDVRIELNIFLRSSWGVNLLNLQSAEHLESVFNSLCHTVRKCVFTPEAYELVRLELINAKDRLLKRMEH